MHLLSEGQIKCFCFCLEIHSVSLSCCFNTTAVTETTPSFFAWTFGRIMQAFPHRDVDMWGRVSMSHFRGLWQSLNVDKEYLFGFETLVFATSGILSIHNQLVTLASYKIYFINLISCEVALQRLYRKKRYINNLELNMIPLKNTSFNCKKFPIHQNESKLSACERRCPKACIPLTSENIPEVSF